MRNPMMILGPVLSLSGVPTPPVVEVPSPKNTPCHEAWVRIRQPAMLQSLHYLPCRCVTVSYTLRVPTLILVTYTEICGHLCHRRVEWMIRSIPECVSRPTTVAFHD